MRGTSVRLRRRIGLLVSSLAIAVLLASTSSTATSAQANESDLDRATIWELSRPGLDLIGVQANGVVVETDFGYRWISNVDQTFTEIDLPGITHVGDNRLLYCDSQRLVIWSGSVTYDGTASDLGVDSIIDCWASGNGDVYLLTTTAGQNEVTSRYFNDQGPEEFVMDYPFSDPVSFLYGSSGVAGTSSGLLVTDASGDRFHSSNFFEPISVEFDFFVGPWPASRSGDVMTVFGWNGRVIGNYEVPAAATEVFGSTGYFFANPTGDGKSLLTAKPQRLESPPQGAVHLELPFVPDRMLDGTVFHNGGVYVEEGDKVRFISSELMLLSQSHTTYNAFSAEVVKIEVWGIKEIGGSIDAGDYDINVERVPGGFQFVPPVMKPGIYDFDIVYSNTLEFQIEMVGWYETVEVHLTAPEFLQPWDDYMGFVCNLFGNDDARVEYNGTVHGVVTDVTLQVPRGSKCHFNGSGWWGEVYEGVHYDYLGFGTTEGFTIDRPMHLRMVPHDPDRVPIWVNVRRSGGAINVSREVVLICLTNQARTDTVFVIDYDQPTRLLIDKSSLGQDCYLVAFEDGTSDLVGIDEYLDFGPPTRLYREGISVPLDRPAWYSITELIVHPLDDNPQFVTQQYDDFLGREPTTTEVIAWAADLDSGKQSKTDLVMNLLGSVEYQNVADPNIRLYQAYFDRLPDAEGLQYWMDVRRGGYSIDLVSEQFTLSEEFRNIYGDTSDAEFIRLVYENVLNRTPDADGYAYWQNLLSTGQITRGQLMVNFSESAEYVRTHAKRVQVVRTYIALLDRIPTGSELANEERKLSGDPGFKLRDLVDNILSGPEYDLRFWDHYRGPRVVNATADFNYLRMSQSAPTVAGLSLPSTVVGS